MPNSAYVDDELLANGIRGLDDPRECERLIKLAAPMLVWLPTPGNPSFPHLDLGWVQAHGWTTGLKIWIDALGYDEEAWCEAAARVSRADELIAVVPGDGLADAAVYRVPLRSWPLNRLLSIYSPVAALLFPEDRGFAFYKDLGEALVAAGPEAFVRAAYPEGVDVAAAEFRAYAETVPHEVTRRVLLDMAERYGPAAPSPPQR